METIETPEVLQRKALSQRSTEEISLIKKNYGTLTEQRSNSGVSNFSHFQDEDFGANEGPDVTINSALNRIKTYRCFFWLWILPMILSFAFSDLLIDSLNFLELLPMGLECKTTEFDSEGKNIWVPCSKNKICNSHDNPNFIVEKGKVVYRKATDDYYTLQNWVESMDIEWRNKFQIGALGSMAFIGMTIGSAAGALLSLKYGRKVVYLGGLFLTTGAAFIVTVQPSYITGLIALLVYGIGVFPRMTIGYVYAMELTPESATQTLGMLWFVGECMTMILSTMYLYSGGRDVLYFVYLSLIFSAVPLAFGFLLPESPKFLHSNKDFEKSKKSLNKIARLNGQWDETFSEINLEEAISRTTQSGIDKNAWFGLVDLWNDKLTLKNTLTMAYLWGFYTFGHHCLIFMMKYIPGDKYTNGLLISIAVTSAPLLTRLIQNLLSSKQIYFLFSFLWGIASIAYLGYFERSSPQATAMIIFIAICIDAIGYTNYYVEFEYFNPRTATLAYGICSMTGRASAIFAPLVVEEFSDWIVIFFFLSVISMIVVFFIEKPYEGEVRINEDGRIEKKIKEMNW